MLRSQLMVNVASGAVATGINIVVLAVAYPVYLHFLGYELYGVWLILGTVLAFAQMGNLQIGPAVTKFVAEEYGREDIGGVARYVLMAMVMLSATGILVLVLILAFNTQIIAVFKLDSDHAEIASRLLPYVGILCVYAFVVHALNATLSGLGRLDLANYTHSAGRVVAVIVASALLCTGLRVESLLVANIVSYMVVHAASTFFIRRAAPVRFLRRENWDPPRLKKLLHFGSGVFGGSLMGLLLSPFHKLMLSRCAGVATVPVYDLAYNGSMQFRSLAEAGLRALMPEISRIGANLTKKARDSINQIHQRAVKYVIVFGAPAYLALFTLAVPLLKIWLRDRYVDTLPGSFRVLLVATFLNLIGVPAYYTLMGLGRVRHTFVSHVLQSLISVAVVLAVALSAALTVEGVAWAVFVGVAASTAYLLCQKRRLFQHERYGDDDHETIGR